MTLGVNASEIGQKKRTRRTIIAVVTVMLLGVSLLVWKLLSLRPKNTDATDASSSTAEAMESEAPSVSDPMFETGDTALITQETAVLQDTFDYEKLEAENAAAYRAAETLLAAGDSQGAYKAFLALEDYQDSSQRARLIYEDATSRETMAKTEVGDSVLFGTYEQDNDRSNGPEWIEWLVLAKEEDRILVITKYVLVSKAYDSAVRGCTWDRCPLRDYLNGTFLNTVFNEEEQDRIPVVTVTADPNPSFDTDPGSDTQDRVFLLSVVETDRYFSSDEARKCLPTATAKAQGIFLSETETLCGIPTCFWWLRQPGRYLKTIACIDDDGTIHPSGYLSDEEYVGVRPALWINVG